MESPVGSFGPSAWLQVQKYAQYLCDREDMHGAFQLLDRAVKEPDARIRMTNDIVFPVIQQWLALYITQQKEYSLPTSRGRRKNDERNSFRNHSNRSRDQRLTHSPLTVWKKIENYQRRGVPLESAVYQKIIEGTSHVNSKKPKNPSGPLLAETILENMMSQSERNNPLVRPSASVFREVLASWDRAASFSYEVATEEATERALALLNQLRTLYDSGWGSDFLPDKLCFYRVMSIFSHIGDGDQVEALLEDLYSLYLDHDENLYDLRPTTPFFSLVLYAWSKSRDPAAAERAEVILDRMLDMEANEDIRDLEVNAKCFNIVMICWSKLRTIESARKVRDVFDRMVELSELDANKAPTGGTYMAMITTWSRFDPEKVEQVFDRWTEEHKNGNCEMRRDSKLLNTVVNAWYRSNHAEKAERGDKLLQDAIQSTLVSWKPTTDTFNMVINAYCQTKRAPGLERAEALLLQMEKLGGTTAPTIPTYFPIIQGWVDLGQIERAEELLIDCFLQISDDEVVSWEESDEEDQDLDTDSTTLSPWHHKKRNKRFRVSKTRLLNIVLKEGWLSEASIHPDAASRAEELLLSTHNFKIKPNAASFQYVLDAWRKNHKHFKGRRHMAQPRIDEILSLMDRESTRLGGNDNLYLTLRRNWKLLSMLQ
ncbi:MAG: hypothetical protein SGILL_002484 [Bacillariaceae sp.]